MLVSRGLRNNLRRQWSTSRLLSSTSTSKSTQAEAENASQPSPETAPKPRKPRKKNATKAFSRVVLEDLQFDTRQRPHHDLSSFLKYAQKVNLDPKSTVYVGTYYEYLTQSALSRLGFTLLPTGGANDYGIDLLGTLSLSLSKHKKPERSINLKIIVQCKALASRGGPNLIRELEGAFNGAPHSFRESGTLGFLVAQKPATKGMRDALARSNWPMGCVTITPEGRVIQMLWNRKAEQQGLHGLGVGIRYVNAKGDEKDGGAGSTGEQQPEQEVVLLWNGETIKSGK